MDTCPYRAIIQEMPFPFAVFHVRGNSWILTGYNVAFQNITGCAIGDSVEDFPFKMCDRHSEIELGGMWYSVYQFTFQSKDTVIIMHDITSRHSLYESLPWIISRAAACI